MLFKSTGFAASCVQCDMNLTSSCPQSGRCKPVSGAVRMVSFHTYRKLLIYMKR